VALSPTRPDEAPPLDRSPPQAGDGKGTLLPAPGSPLDLLERPRNACGVARPELAAQNWHTHVSCALDRVCMRHTHNARPRG